MRDIFDKELSLLSLDEMLVGPCEYLEPGESIFLSFSRAAENGEVFYNISNKMKEEMLDIIRDHNLQHGKELLSGISSYDIYCNMLHMLDKNMKDRYMLDFFLYLNEKDPYLKRHKFSCADENETGKEYRAGNFDIIALKRPYEHETP